MPNAVKLLLLIIFIIYLQMLIIVEKS
jgi:hypothetical protein